MPFTGYISLEDAGDLRNARIAVRTSGKEHKDNADEKEVKEVGYERRKEMGEVRDRAGHLAIDKAQHAAFRRVNRIGSGANRRQPTTRRRKRVRFHVIRGVGWERRAFVVFEKMRVGDDGQRRGTRRSGGAECSGEGEVEN